MSRLASAPELLAPAGDWDALRAAVANGADAVYFGLSNFNARHRATNFGADELPAVMQFLHERGVLGYVTLNTLIFSDELAEISRVVEKIAAARVDAVIVQDLGLAKLIRSIAPELPVHGSTQMTLTEPRAIELVRSLGLTRVILARELSADEIRKIVTATDLPVEVFVHGALCVAYSGQCLTSEALGGRSANRGQCAQACRLPYDMIVDGEYRPTGDRSYLLSPQDLAAHGLIAELAEIGVASFKIEGRLKSAEYVAMTTQTYRAAIDAAMKHQPFQLSEQGQLDLAQTYSRGFTPGFLTGVNHQRLVSGRFPKSRGVRVGRVTGTSRRGVLVSIDPAHTAEVLAGLLKPGDGVVFDEGHPEQQEQGGRLFHVNPQPRRGGSGISETLVELVFGDGSVDLNRIEAGAIVWKTDDPALRKRLQRSFTGELPKRARPVSFELRGEIGGPLELIAKSGDRRTTAAWPGPLQLARKHPLTLDAAREQLARLGDTPFELADVSLQLSGNVMVPKSVLNDLRRQAVAELAMHEPNEAAAPPRIDTRALHALRCEIVDRNRRPVPERPQLFVLARSLEQVSAIVSWKAADPAAKPAMIYCDFEDVRRYSQAVALCKEANYPVGLATLRVLKPGEEGWLAHIAKAKADAVLVRNLTSISYFREHAPETTLIGDYSLNVANDLTADLVASFGLRRLVPSFDLNWEQFAALVERSDPGLLEVVIHQHMPMFHMEHCVFAAMLSSGKDYRDCGRPCDHHRVELRDRVGSEFPLLPDAGCRNTVFNSVAQSAAEFVPRMLKLGLRNFRIDLLREDESATIALVDRYTKVLAGIESGSSTWRQLQVLNQLGVTRGTMQLS